MCQSIIFAALLITYATSNPQLSSREWLNQKLLINSRPPIAYLIQLENDEIETVDYKSKRSILNTTDEYFFPNKNLKRYKRAIDDYSTKNRFPRDDPKVKELNVKANLRYHHQQRHPNGSVTGSYGQLAPNGQMKVIHYISDDKGFREYPEGSESQVQTVRSEYLQVTTPSNSNNRNNADRSVSIVTNSNNGFQPVSNSQQYISHITPIVDNIGSRNLGNSQREFNGFENPNLNFVTDIPPYFPPNVGQPVNLPPGPTINVPTGIPSPIVQSAAGSINKFSPRSPLFDKYYRPSPDEIQRTHDYHKMRSNMDVNAFRPPEATSAFPEIPRDKQPELRATFGEYQIPYSTGDYRAAPGPPYAPLDLQPTNAPDPLSRQTYYVDAFPQTLQPQSPIYLQSYDGQAFVPGSTYSGPYMPNTATFNQPYPTNIPIYNNLLPQNTPTYNQPLPNIPVYNQVPVVSYPQNVYYSNSDPRPAVISKL